MKKMLPLRLELIPDARSCRIHMGRALSEMDASRPEDRFFVERNGCSSRYIPQAADCSQLFLNLFAAVYLQIRLAAALADRLERSRTEMEL